jgi:hypothetical protein
MRIWLWAALAVVMAVGGCPKGDDATGKASAGPPAAASAEGAGGAGQDDADASQAGDNEIIEVMPPGVETQTFQGELPPGWPSEVQLYPDAALGETSVSQLPEGAMYSAKLTTSASVEQVSDFHLHQIEQQHGHVSELTISPTVIDETYLCNDYSMTLQAERQGELTKVTVRVNPPAPKGMVQPSMRQYVNLDKVPEGFPEDLMPRYPGSRIINGFTDGPIRSSIEMTTDDDLETAAEYYRAHFVDLGWVENSKAEQKIVRAYTFRKDQDKIILNVSSGGEGEPNHITITFTGQQRNVAAGGAG